MTKFIEFASAEAMIQFKIDALNERITDWTNEMQEAVEASNLNTVQRLSAKITDARVRKSALGAAKMGLKFCEAFEGEKQALHPAVFIMPTNDVFQSAEA